MFSVSFHFLFKCVIEYGYVGSAKRLYINNIAKLTWFYYLLYLYDTQSETTPQNQDVKKYKTKNCQMSKILCQKSKNVKYQIIQNVKGSIKYRICIYQNTETRSKPNRTWQMVQVSKFATTTTYELYC